MSTRVFPSLPMLGWPVTREPVVSTRRQESISGKETVIADQSTPRYLFTLTADRLRQGTVNGAAYTELAQLQGFFEVGKGGADSFLYQDADDNAVTAQQIGVDPVVLVAANSSGGVCGKMISPQSISVATSATDQVGKEGDIFRFTLKHSLILTAVVGIMVTLQAYVFKWIIPVYEKTAAAAPAVAKAAVKTAAPLTNGSEYLIGTFAVALLITVFSMLAGKMIQAQEGADKIHFH